MIYDVLVQVFKVNPHSNATEQAAAKMRYILARFYELGGRVGGPMTFRLILQPTIATLVALRAGLRDAREGRPAYFWTLLTGRGHRIKLLREGWRAIFKIFILAVIMDVIYELIVLGWIYPFENLLVATILAVVPYVMVRGPVNRLARRWHPGGHSKQ